MVKRVLGIVILMLIGAGVVLIGPWFRDPTFVVANETSQEVNVIAYWRNEVRQIGIIQPSALYTFTVDDEAAMKISVRYANGRMLDSSEFYFTSGIVVLVTISKSGIDIDYETATNRLLYQRP